MIPPIPYTECKVNINKGLIVKAKLVEIIAGNRFIFIDSKGGKLDVVLKDDVSFDIEIGAIYEIELN